MLIRALLHKDPLKRAGLTLVESSQWYRKMKEQLAQLDEDERSDPRRNSNVIERLISFGFPLNAIKDTIDKKKLNHIHACFYLLKA